MTRIPLYAKFMRRAFPWIRIDPGMSSQGNLSMTSDKGTRPAKGTSNVVFWAATILLSIGLIIAGAETCARWAGVKGFHVEQASYSGWAQSDDVLGWRNRPGVFPAHEGTHEPMTFLLDGSRATGAPPDGNASVLLVGCSYTTGYGVRDEETFAGRLQQRFPEIRIRNFGVSGYGTYQSFLLLRELLETRVLRPKVVIYGFLPTHAERNVLTYQNLEAYRNYGGERFALPRVEVRNDRLVTFPPFVVPNWPFEQSSAAVSLLHATALRSKLSDREQYEIPATRILISQMKDLVERANARFLLATLHDDGPPGPEPSQRMRDDIRRSGIEELNVTYRGAETRPEKLLVGGNGHPGPVIHQWWADKIAARLARENFETSRGQ